MESWTVKQTTFAHLLKDAGYRTCIAGKWQLGKEQDSPQHFGFEKSLLWQHTRGRTGREKRDSRYPNPQLERNGVKEDYENGEFSSNLFVDFIGNFMEENKEQPFLVYYPMALVHCPFCPTPDSDDWDPKSFGSKDYKGQPQYFGDMVAYVDKTIGKINQKLDDLGIRDNTLLIFTGDNGTDVPIVTNTTFGKVAGAKGQMIDAGNHVTCIVSWPSVIREGRVTKDIIDFSDMLPTMCEAAGAKIPDDLVIDGQSFLPQIRGEKGTHARIDLYVVFPKWRARQSQRIRAQPALQAVRRWKDVRRSQRPVGKEPVQQPEFPEAQKQKRDSRPCLQARLDSFADVVPPQARSPKKKKQK